MSKAELLFVVEEDLEGGYVAQAVGEDIVTQGETIEEIRTAVRDAVECHFGDPALRPAAIRLHIVHDEVLAS